ncbi:MAG TPA: rhomboid family intramembrane serine protease [Candidatus Binatia bacterium]|jgi:GlpG protein|nr:rhomboid family intramembrane serine protease [Candidatus Binatia bacterium]
MRLIGHLPSETSARTFGDYIYSQGIENQLEFTQGDGWGVWVNDEEQLENATKLLDAFRANPTDPKYRAQAKSAEELRAQKAKSDEAWRKKLKDRRQLFRPLTGYGFGPVTFALIAFSVAVAFLSNVGMNPERVHRLFITDFKTIDNFITWDSSLPEIRHGQIWRLFTPMFIHFGVAHILFNMLWLRDLGSMIEGRQSSWYLAVLTLVIAAGSNLAQFYIGPGHGPDFGGMSGVVYGLLGYIWMRGKFDPASGLYLHPSTVVMMLIWLVAGFTGILTLLVGPVANTVHLAGLVIGAAWGYLSSLRHR